jgi:predicted nucleic acid-binding protein
MDDGKATMLLSVALALEYESKCKLAEHRLAAAFSLVQAEAFVDGLIAVAELVQSPFRWRPQLRDPGDELVLEAAVNGRASAIVTFNERDLRAAERSFGIAVIRPGEALRRVGQ